jgi:glycosyltransferase involved in cell wall biosynthesis
MSEISIVYDFLKEVGGLERVMFFQANELNKSHKTDLLFSYINKSKAKKTAEDLGLKKNIPINSIGSTEIESLELFLSLIFPSRMRNIKSKLFISHSFMSSRMCYQNKKSLGMKYAVMIHHPPNFLYGRTWKWANNFPRRMAYLAGLFLGPWMRRTDIAAVKNADLVFANSKYTQKRIREIYGIESVLVYPPIGREFKIEKKESVRKIIKEMKIERKFVYLHGRMIKDKRPDLAVRAVSVLKDVDLIISGTIEEEEKIKDLISSLGMEKRVRLLGRVSQEQLVALYNSAECFIMSAPKEDFGLTVVESMACGLPVVAWNDGSGPSEIIVEGKNGLLARPYDFKDMAKKIDACCNKNWNRKSIAKSVENFSEEKISKILNKSIDKLLT